VAGEVVFGSGDFEFRLNLFASTVGVRASGLESAPSQQRPFFQYFDRNFMARPVESGIGNRDGGRKDAGVRMFGFTNWL
jgi:hypothetical protein